MPKPADSDKSKDVSKTDEALVALSKMMENLPKELQSSFKAALTDIQREQIAAAAAAKKAAADDADDSKDDDVDLEAMDRKQFASWMAKSLLKEVNKALKPVSEQLNKVEDTRAKNEVANEIKDMRAKHPDFDEWKAEMNAIYQKNPSYSISDLYDLAKSRHPEKAAELAEKQKEESKDDKRAEQKFGGLFPTNIIGEVDDEARGKMDTKDAAQAAWDAVMPEVDESVLGDFLST